VLVARLGVNHLDRDGHDLALELACLLRGGRLLERVGRERVLRVARNVVLRSNVLA